MEKGIIKIFMGPNKGKTQMKMLSRIYLSLQSERGISTTYIKLRWEKEANIKITEENWLNMCKTVNYSKLGFVERIYMEE